MIEPYVLLWRQDGVKCLLDVNPFNEKKVLKKFGENTDHLKEAYDIIRNKGGFGGFTPDFMKEWRKKRQ